MALVDFNPHSLDKFYYVEGETTVKDIVKDLATEITSKADSEYQWTLLNPASVDSVENTFIVSTETSNGYTYYVKFERHCATANDLTTASLFEMLVSYSNEYDTVAGDLKDEIASPVTHLSWYKDNLNPSVKDWLPVSYWLQMTKDHMHLILRGDPSADIYPYNDYLTTYMYAGILDKLDAEQAEDKQYNFAVTTGSQGEPQYGDEYGPRTATGTTDVSMMGNKAGMPFQPHYPAFYTSNQFMDKLNIEGSRWNHNKHQFSDITLIHPIDMERGKMEDVLVGDAEALYDNDKLVFKQNTKEQEMYKKFAITAPYTFLNNSANQKYCLAIRCYNDDLTIKIEDTETTTA